MLNKRGFTLALAVAAAAAGLLAAEYAPAPESYSVTVSNSLMGPPIIQQIWRDGSKAVIETTSPPAQPGGQPSHVRVLYDLAAHTSVAWDPTVSAPQCGSSKFGGDWGDPFASSKEMNGELFSKQATQAGTETLNGITTQLFNADLGADGKARVWLEPKYGLIMKAELTAPNAEPHVIMETKKISFAKPAASVFVVPSACGASAVQGPSPVEQEIAAETGEPALNFSTATDEPATDQACTVLFRMVQKGSMGTVNGGYQIGVDPDSDEQNPPRYRFGTDSSGHMIVSGGHLTEVTSQMRNGVLRIANPGRRIHVEIRLPNGGGEATLYRRCAGPETTLLFVVTSLDHLSPSDWLWVKSGKQAGH